MLLRAEVSNVASNLVNKSKQIRWKARKLNWLALWQKYAPCLGILLVVVIVLYVKFLW